MLGGNMQTSSFDISDVVEAEPTTFQRLLTFVRHNSNCDWLQPMWHKGPCDCGLFDLLDKLRAENGGTLPPELTDRGRGLVRGDQG
jgi:hypothetical protein